MPLTTPVFMRVDGRFAMLSLRCCSNASATPVFTRADTRFAMLSLRMGGHDATSERFAILSLRIGDVVAMALLPPSSHGWIEGLQCCR
jgi:hypothetical protein